MTDSRCTCCARALTDRDEVACMGCLAEARRVGQPASVALAPIVEEIRQAIAELVERKGITARVEARLNAHGEVVIGVILPGRD